NAPAMLTTSAFCAELLWARSELKPKDMACAQIYDAFTPLVVMGLEDYGFCKRGEGGPFTDGGRLELGGALPVLTSGGGLSEAYVHGFNLILEGVRQIRGTSSNQVPGCRATLVTGASGVATSALVLRGESGRCTPTTRWPTSTSPACGGSGGAAAGGSWSPRGSARRAGGKG